MPERWLGLDIGGANLKAATCEGWCVSRPFPLWRQPDRLSNAIAEIIGEAPDGNRIAATMTGELADCFATKAEGVRFIVKALQKAAPERGLSIYLVDGSFADPVIACERPLLAAASNWHALASLVGQMFTAERGVDSDSLLMDLGSTTCDLIPIVGGRPATIGLTDPERLVSGELVYAGVVRTPLCAVVRELPWRGRLCPVAAELFATTGDAYLLLRELPEAARRTDTADGRAATRTFAHDRLARSICADRTMFDEHDAQLATRAVRDAQISLLASALERVLARVAKPPVRFVVSGEGEFLLRDVIQAATSAGHVVSLGDRLGARLSACAPAYAVAMLASGTKP